MKSVMRRELKKAEKIVKQTLDLKSHPVLRLKGSSVSSRGEKNRRHMLMKFWNCKDQN